MLLSAWAVIYISTPESYAATEEALADSYYVVQSNTETDSNTQQLGNSLLNALVIVSVICAMTFVIVLLYKYNCIKCLTGYMIVSMGLLLGCLAAVMFQVFLERYTIYLDIISFTIIMFNFAVVGVISIFLGGPGSTTRIVPVYMNQIYLVLTSVIVAWQLSHFDPWTAWVLLILLAFYDLFAVLTPCGPLKALVNLMHRENAPAMPGLLYEASLPNSARDRSRSQNTSGTTSAGRNGRRQNHRRDTTTDAATTETAASTTANINDRTNTSSTVEFEHQPLNGGDHHNITLSTITNTTTPPLQHSTETITTPFVTGVDQYNNDSNNGGNEAAAGTTALAYDVDTGEPSTSLYYTSDSHDNETIEVSQPLVHHPTNNNNNNNNNTAYIPFALAKLYKLPFRSDPQPPWITGAAPPRRRDTNNNDHPPNYGTTSTTATTTTGPDNAIEYTPSQLRQVVEVIFPHGGRIVPTASMLDRPVAELYRRTQYQDRDAVRYSVIDAQGVHKRVLFVNVEGRVFEDLREENLRNERRDRVRNSIKLGLGDFIFYSILVSKAALYSYTTFVVCTLAVLSGLGITLLLLAMYGQALPALPVSIMLGVLFYVITRYAIEPWVEAVFVSRVYV